MKTEEITIKIPSEFAEAYRNATQAEQEQIQLKITAIFPVLIRKKEAIYQLRKTMNEISAEAQAKGLTPEILKSILDE